MAQVSDAARRAALDEFYGRDRSSESAAATSAIDGTSYWLAMPDGSWLPVTRQWVDDHGYETTVLMS